VVIARGQGFAAPLPVRWSPDEAIEALFGRLPPLRTEAAERAGFASDRDGQALVRHALLAV
jgi:D-erythronate 2-dehydrogenase